MSLKRESLNYLSVEEKYFYFFFLQMITKTLTLLKFLKLSTHSNRHLKRLNVNMQEKS